MRKIAVLNQKGGVGKTTTVVNLGACLCELGKKVLLVDMDPQANLTLHLGLELLRGEPSVYTLLQGEHPPEMVVRDTKLEGLKIIPSDIDLAGLEVELAVQGEGRELRLAQALQAADGNFDYLFVDCPPSLGLLTLNGVCAVEEIFIPLQTEFFALQGLGRLLHTVQLVRSKLNPEVDITGIIACMYDGRTSLAVEVLEEIRRHFGEKVFGTVIRKNVRLAEAPSFGIPITLYDAKCYGAEDYRSLAREVLTRAAQISTEASATESAQPLQQTTEAVVGDVPIAKAG